LGNWEKKIPLYYINNNNSNGKGFIEKQTLFGLGVKETC
jgi:hypothetical protein